MSGRDELCSAWLGRLPTVDVDEDEDDAPVKDNMDVLAQMLEERANSCKIKHGMAPRRIV